MNVPDELMKIVRAAEESYDRVTPRMERRLPERRKAILSAFLDAVETRVYRSFLAADEDNTDLNSMTVPELTAMVMRAVRGGPDAR